MAKKKAKEGLEFTAISATTGFGELRRLLTATIEDLRARRVGVDGAIAIATIASEMRKTCETELELLERVHELELERLTHPPQLSNLTSSTGLIEMDEDLSKE